MATDAPSRNALTKLHGALGKVVGEAGAIKKGVEDGVTVLDEGEGKTMAEEDEAEAPALGSEEDVKVEKDVKVEREEEPEDMIKLKDSLLEELLDDEDEEL